MDKDKKKILFISHDASLTGAPVLLLNLLKLLVKRNAFHITLILYRGGVLENEFKEILPVHVLKTADYFKKSGFVFRIADFLAYRVRKLIFRIGLKRPDLLFSNTIVNGLLVKELRSGRIPVLTYIHELESVINEYNKDGSSDESLLYSDFFISPSKVVAANLVARHGIPIEKIVYLDYFLPAVNNDPTCKQTARQAFFKQHEIPDGKFYIVGMGVASYRKGFDIFVETCKLVNEMESGLQFIWIGDFENEENRNLMTRRIDEYQISGVLRMTGTIPYSAYTLQSFDIFALTSREDPYPLVVIEAARMQVPTVCFEGSGGAPEFVSTDCGWVIPGFSPANLAAKLLELKSRDQEIREKGVMAYKKANERHADEEHIFDQFNGIIERALK